MIDVRIVGEDVLIGLQVASGEVYQMIVTDEEGVELRNTLCALYGMPTQDEVDEAL